MKNTNFGCLVHTKERDGRDISVFHTHAHVDQAILDADFRNAWKSSGRKANRQWI
jgi:hypothetical protein